ncbi:MAG: hypothetical protein AMXMBFR80_12070 [Dehalococcoidia bacterium]
MARGHGCGFGGAGRVAAPRSGGGGRDAPAGDRADMRNNSDDIVPDDDADQPGAEPPTGGSDTTRGMPWTPPVRRIRVMLGTRNTRVRSAIAPLASSIDNRV